MSSRPQSLAARDPQNHHYTPAAGLPDLREAVAEKTLRDSGLAVAAFAGDRHRTVASRPSTSRSRRSSTRATRSSCHPVLDDVPRGRQARGRRARRGLRRRRPAATRSPSSSSRPPAPSARRCCCSCRPSNPTGAVYSSEEQTAHRRVGARARHLGDHRRDLPEPRLRRREGGLDRRGGARARRTRRCSSTVSRRPTR